MNRICGRGNRLQITDYREEEEEDDNDDDDNDDDDNDDDDDDDDDDDRDGMISDVLQAGKHSDPCRPFPSSDRTARPSCACAWCTCACWVYVRGEQGRFKGTHA